MFFSEEGLFLQICYTIGQLLLQKPTSLTHLSSFAVVGDG
jgi:hypothetical protein